MQSHLGGVLILSKYIKGMPGYDKDDTDKVKDLTEKADEQFAVIYIWYIQIKENTAR